MKRIRCSSNPLAEDCAQSLEQPAVSVIGDEGPAAGGSMTHELTFSGILLGKEHPLQDIDLDALAARWGADKAEASMLASATWRLWKENRLAQVFPDPEIEAELRWHDEVSDVILTGHADILSLVDREVRILDLKTGRLDIDPQAQLKGYALIALRSEDADTAYAAQLRPRDGVFEAWQWTRAELEAWWQGFVAHLWRGEYRTGEHCTRCHRWLECPAATMLVRASVHRLSDVDGEFPQLQTLTNDELLGLYAARKIVAKVTDEADKLIKIEVDRRGGKVLREDGTGIGFRVTNNREIDVHAGLAVINETLGTDAWKAMSLANGAAEKIIRDHAPPRMKGKRVKEFYERLEADGAITTHEVRSLVAMRETPAAKQLGWTAEEVEQLFGIELVKEPITKAASAAEESGEG